MRIAWDESSSLVRAMGVPGSKRSASPCNRHLGAESYHRTTAWAWGPVLERALGFPAAPLEQDATKGMRSASMTTCVLVPAYGSGASVTADDVAWAHLDTEPKPITYHGPIHIHVYAHAQRHT